MSNALALETSPYLLQHAHNPVAWLPWGEEAFVRARQEDRPVFLSVGYAACHWCHVMAHESFEDPATASLLNEHFIPVKVDREERPDIDSLYMDAVVSLTGHGGWPMSVFLTPDGRPFYGGTYFPPAPRHGLPSFREVLLGVHRAWVEDRERLLQSAGQLSEQLAAASAAIPAGEELRPETLLTAADALWRSFDAAHGGWGGAPKFPSALAVEFLFRCHVRAGDPLARDLASQTLEAMADGGIYDQLGGGFHRYSVDAAWTVPHFEKMLYDNALLARAYRIGWQVTGKERLLEVARGILDFLLEEMTLPDGGLASSIDADSEGEEGKYYVWTEAEVRAALADPELVELSSAAWGITPQGNFEGRNVLIRAADDTALEARFGHASPRWREKLEESRRKLLAARRERIRPTLDDKALTAWNGLALWSFAEAARVLGDERYRTAAQSLASFLLEKPWLGGELARSWRMGEARHRAYLEDHAALGLGLLALYQTDFNPRWFTAARHRADEILAAFSDPAGGFYDTRHDHEPLLARPRSLQDSPVPSGSTMAAMLLLQIAALTGESRYEQAARRPMEGMQDVAARHPSAFAGWLCAIDFGLEPPLQLAVVGPREHQGFESFLQVANGRFLPGLVMAAGLAGESDPPLLRNRETIGGVPTAYLCRQFTCELPTTSAKELAEQISRSAVPSAKA